MKYLFVILLTFLIFSIEGCLFSDTPPHIQMETIIDSLNQSGSSNDRFTIVGNNLCIASNSTLKIYNIQNASTPMQLTDFGIGTNVLSVRSYKDSLLVEGDQNGLSLFTIAGSTLKDKGIFNASQYYDPFVYNSDYIYMLESKSYVANGNTHPDELSIFNPKSPASPVFNYRKNLYLPKDISMDSGSNIFVCDSGLKVFDESVDTALNLKYHFKIDANRITAFNDNLFIMGNKGLYQYTFSGNSIKLLSIIAIVSNP